jgi:uncharacterized protein (DUF58 family)
MKLRSFILILLDYLLLLAGLLTLRGEILVFAVPLTLYLFLGLWRAPQGIKLDARRTLGSERVSPGIPVQVTIQVTNNSSDLDDLVLEDILPAGLKVVDGSNRHMLSLPSGKKFEWSYSFEGQRGYYVFTDVIAEGGDIFGLFSQKIKIPAPGQVLVQPPVVRIRGITIRPRRTNVYSGIIPAHTGGPGVEFFGVREYQPGDPMHWINWNISARQTQRIYSNEFEQERVSDVGIILDGRAVANPKQEGGSIFEYSIQAAAAMAVSFLNQGNRVGLLQYGRYMHWTFPGYGKIQKERILQSLAHAEIGESLVFTNLGHLPTQFFPSHSQIILVSPLTQADYPVLIHLRARGYQVLVVSPNPVSFEISQVPPGPEISMAGRVLRLERKILLNKIRRAGVQVWDWDVSVPMDQAGARSLGRPISWFRAIGR